MQFNAGNLGTQAYSLGTVTLDTGATTFDIAAAVEYSINGKAYTEAIGANEACPTTDGNTGSAFVALSEDQGCFFVLGINGTATGFVLNQGPVETLDGTAGADPDFASDNRLPQLPYCDLSVMCPIAIIAVKYTGTSTFTASSDNWDTATTGTGVLDIMALPSRPVDITCAQL